MKYMLDTSFLIDYMRDDRAAVTRFADMFENGDQPIINEVVVCELLAGIAPRQEAEVDALLEPLEFVQPGPETAIEAGRWRQEARQAGSTLSLPDALIAAAAHANDAVVLTRNLRDFALTPARVEAY